MILEISKESGLYIILLLKIRTSKILYIYQLGIQVKDLKFLSIFGFFTKIYTLKNSEKHSNCKNCKIVMSPSTNYVHSALFVNA